MQETFFPLVFGSLGGYIFFWEVLREDAWNGRTIETLNSFNKNTLAVAVVVYDGHVNVNTFV